jgi:hypothetical protein
MSVIRKGQRGKYVIWSFIPVVVVVVIIIIIINVVVTIISIMED